MRAERFHIRKVRALPSAPGHPCFSLTEDLHGCRSGEHAQLPGRCDLRVCLVWIVFSVRWRCCLIHEHTRLSQSGLTMNQSQTAVLLGFLGNQVCQMM